MTVLNDTITQDKLKEYLKYNPETGHFFWAKITNSSIRIGSKAGSYHPTGYIYVGLFGVSYAAHRLAFLYMTGADPKDQVDHINHTRDDNRFSNIRVVTNAGNQRNAEKRHDNTSGITGVSWNKNSRKWYANMGGDGCARNLGYFDDFFEAVCARKSAENKYNYHPNHGKSIRVFDV